MDKFTELAEFFIRKAIDQERQEGRFEEDYLKYLELGESLLLSEATKIVFSVCESPIEKIFINALFLSFIKADPFGLVITPPLKNGLLDMQNFRKYHAMFLKFISWFQQRYGSLAEIDKYLDGEVSKGKMRVEEQQWINKHLILYHYLGLYDDFHLSLQPCFTNLKVDGKSLRPDILIWVPAIDNVKIIVECDGFDLN
jgi:hypothetical protein